MTVGAHLAAKVEGVLFAAGDGVHKARPVRQHRNKVLPVAHRLPQDLSASLPLAHQPPITLGCLYATLLLDGVP